MSKRHKSQIKGNDPSGRRKRIGKVWLCTSLVAGLVVAGVVALKLRQPDRSGPIRSTVPAAADADSDRELRHEQLDAAQKLLTEFPTNDDVVYLAGLVHEDQGDTDRAMKLWARSIELDATRGDANESLGQALLLRDDYAAAEKYLRRALEIDTNSVNARFRLAKTLSQQGKLQEALVVLEKAGTLSAEGYRLMGEICQQLNQHERARTNYEAAIRLKADFPEAYYGLALTFAQLGEAGKSRELMDKSSVLRKESEEQARRARAEFNPLTVTRQSVARTHTDVGRVYMIVGRTTKAEELWLRAAALDPKNVLCRLQLAVLYQQTRRDREALHFYEQAARLDPRDGLTHLNMGRVCMKLQNPDRAQMAFKEVIRLEPKRPEGYSALAQLYIQTRSNLAEAERLATVATELSKEAPYFALLSQACAQNGNRDGALSAINQAIELQPANPQFVQMRETILAAKR
jgi:tetratricopeptide (TPR) repeat protein